MASKSKEAASVASKINREMELLEGLIFFVAVLLVTPVIYAISVNALYNFFSTLPAYSSLAIMLVCFAVSVVVTRLLFALQSAVLHYIEL
jgi:hypothetical protein